jgi:hypothetical protein
LFCREFMSYLCCLYLFTHTSVQHDFYVRWFSCLLSATWQVSLVEQELLTFRFFLWVSYSSIKFNFLSIALWIIVYLFCPFSLPLYYLFFYDLRLPINYTLPPFLSSNLSWHISLIRKKSFVEWTSYDMHCWLA